MCIQSVPGTDVHLVRLFVRLPPIAEGSQVALLPRAPSLLHSCPKIVLLLFGGKGGKRSRKTGAQVKDRDPCACAQESLPEKMKARPNGRAELSVRLKKYLFGIKGYTKWLELGGQATGSHHNGNATGGQLEKALCGDGRFAEGVKVGQDEIGAGKVDIMNRWAYELTRIGGGEGKAGIDGHASEQACSGFLVGRDGHHNLVCFHGFWNNEGFVCSGNLGSMMCRMAV